MLNACPFGYRLNYGDVRITISLILISLHISYANTNATNDQRIKFAELKYICNTERARLQHKGGKLRGTIFCTFERSEQMFGIPDLIALVISAFIILPVVVFLRQSGYLLMSMILGVKNPRLTVGSGPRIIKIGVFDIRKYYHLYSWFSYDSLKRQGKLAYIALYASPILLNTVVAITLNAMVANGMFEERATFFNRFVFYAFYFVLFDIIPMKTANGMPNNGLIIYEMLRYGKRTDFNNEPFLPSTTEVEEQYAEDVEKMEELKEHQKEQVEQERKNDNISRAEEKDQKEEIEEDKQESKESLEEIKDQRQDQLEEYEDNIPK